jgi:hypothetical protein
MLKKIMIGAAFAAMISAPAVAQSYNPAMGTGNVTAPPQAHGYTGNVHAYAYAPRSRYTSAYGPIRLPFDAIAAVNPFAYNAYAYEPSPYHHRYYGRRWYRY